MAEIAGLVMAAFPLLIEGLKIYANGARTILDMTEHDLILDAFRRDIEMEEAKFYDTVLQILEDMTSVQPLIRAELVDNPGSLQWRSPEVKIALERRLSQSSSLQFVRATEEIYTILQCLQKDFEPKRNSLGTKFRRKSLKKLLEKLDVALNEDYRNKKVGRIRQLNADIRTLACGRMHNISGSVISPACNPAKHYERIKKHAGSLYHTMKEKFQDQTCVCEEPHCASLQLETSTPHLKVLSSTRFQLLFLCSITPNPRYDWRQLELESLDSEDNPACQLQTCQHLSAPQSSLDYSTIKTHLANHMSPTTPDYDIDDNKATGMSMGPPPLILNDAKKPRPNAGIGIAIKSMIRIAMGATVQHLRVPEGDSLSISRSTSPSPGGARGNSSISRSTSPAPECRPGSSNQTGIRGRRHVAFADTQEEAIASTPPRSPEGTCGLITCLCSTINSPLPNPDANNRPPNQVCLGIIVNNQDAQRHRLRLPLRGWLTFQPTGTVSLDSILNCPTDCPTPTLRDRLRLGVNIASALMQLHESTWLNQNWGKNDIFFLQGPHGPVLEKPLVHRVFQREEDSKSMLCTTLKDPTASEWILAFCNRSVFCLGVILIELWHWKPLSVLQAESGRSQEIGDTNPLSEFVTAQRLAQDLLTNAGAPYGMAVKLCIMGLEHKETDLEQKDFKNEVYKKVVYPLEENLKNFWGVTDLADIYQE